MTKIDAARIHNNTLVGTVEMADHFHEPKLPSELLGVGTLGTSVLLMIGAVRGQMGKNLSKRIGGMKKYF
ncbi:hypothetical protein HYV57_01485 [Candidatus Peregrinibacteria bacterium]|nr:hypothetical protein [Candidatus Peregrinibacteria bacterium]